MILADWQADEGQEGLSGIKVLQSCVCCLDASDIRGESGWRLETSARAEFLGQVREFGRCRLIS